MIICCQSDATLLSVDISLCTFSAHFIKCASEMMCGLRTAKYPTMHFTPASQPQQTYGHLSIEKRLTKCLERKLSSAFLSSRSRSGVCGVLHATNCVRDLRTEGGEGVEEVGYACKCDRLCEWERGRGGEGGGLDVACCRHKGGLIVNTHSRVQWICSR